MKKGFLGSIGLAVIIVAGLICVAKCSVRVPAGYVAVEYKMNGEIKCHPCERVSFEIPPFILYSTAT